MASTECGGTLGLVTLPSLKVNLSFAVSDLQLAGAGFLQPSTSSCSLHHFLKLVICQWKICEQMVYVGDKSTWFDYAWQHFVFCLLVLGLVFFAMRDISLNRCTNWWVPVLLTLLMSIALIIATCYKLYKLGGTRTATKLRISKSLKPLISKTMSSDITCCKFANLQ